MQARLRRGRLDHRPVRREVAAQHGEAVPGDERRFERQDHVIVEDFGTGDVLAESLAVHCHRLPMQQTAEAGEQRAQSAGVVEVFHQVLARRPDVREEGCLAGERIELVEVERHAGAARHRDQVHDRVGRTADREHGGHGIVEGSGRDEVGRLEVVPHHLDDARAGQCGHRRMARVGGGYRRSAGQREAQRLGGARHRRRGSHRHAVAGRARDALLDLVHVGLGDVAGAKLGPVFPDIAAGTERSVTPVAAQHRPRRQIDRRQVHRGRAHDHRRRRLVAAAHQHCPVDRMRAELLLGLHGEEIPVEHRRRLLEGLGQAHRRDLHREPACLPDAPLDVLDAFLEMHVAGVEIAPRVEDRDHRLARVLAAVESHLRRARPMAERAQVLDAEPPVAAQVLRFLLAHAPLLVDRFGRWSCGVKSPVTKPPPW